jgi:hypothetical protein
MGLKHVEHLLKRDVIGVCTLVEHLAALSDHGVHEALVKESAVDAFASHEVDKVFERALETVVEMLSHITKHMLSFIL